MTGLHFALKLIHVLGAAVLFGSGLGIAFFMWMAHLTGRPALIAGTARIVVIADTMFTATAVVLQPITGFWLLHIVGYSFSDCWIAASLVLYVLVGLCWLPVIWIQIQLRDIAAQAAEQGTVLPARYHRLFRIWFVLGWPAFLGVIAIFWLMIAKPV
jgi:uncharacterized membrane protein